MYEELLTNSVIESVGSSRPFCYVYDDSIEEDITPSHLLLGRCALTKLDSNFNENNMDCDALSRRAHYLQILILHKWNRRRQEYLSKLRKRHELTNVIPGHQIKLNKVVIVEETHVPRSRLKTGQAEEFVTRKDYFIKRSVNKLYLLEI